MHRIRTFLELQAKLPPDRPEGFAKLYLVNRGEGVQDAGSCALTTTAVSAISSVGVTPRPS